MGLPLWREPEKKSSSKEAAKRTATAPPQICDRVATGAVDRRRVYSNRHRSARREFRRPRLDLVSSVNYPGSQAVVDDQENAASSENGVPSVSNLFEVANRQENERLDRIEAERAAHEEYLSRTLLERYTGHDLRFQASGETVAPTASTQRPSSRGAMVEGRVRLMQNTSRAVSSLRRDNSAVARTSTTAVPRPPTFSPPSPGTANRRLRRARALTASDDHAVRIPPTPVDGPGERVEAGNVDGLGDRNRSPTPQEAWEVMRSTIQPDITLPSEESSFTTAVASQSYAASLPSTVITEDMDTSSSQGQEQNNAEESASSINTDACEDDMAIDTTESLARDMYYREMETPEGRERIAEQQALRAREGNRFAMADEAASVDIGFRLIEAALERIEERHRTLRLRGRHRSAAEYGPDLARLSGIIEDDRARQVSDEAQASQDPPEAHPVGSSIDGPRPVDREVDGLYGTIDQALINHSEFSDEWLASMGFSRSANSGQPRRSHLISRSTRGSG